MKPILWSAVFALTTAAHAVSAQEFKFNIGTVLDPKHPVSLGMMRMAESAEKQSGGRLKLEIFPSSQLGAQREMWQNVQAGLIGGIIDPTASLANFVPQFAVLDLPYLVDNADKAFKLLESPVVEKELSALAPAAGFRVVRYWEVTFRNVYTRTPVNTLADLKGRKIRVIPNPTFIALFRGLGAAPTPMAFGELYTALQQGVVDGAENDAVTYFSTKHFEVAKNYALTNHLMLINTLVFSEKQWQRMPENLRAILSKAALEGSKLTMDDRHKRDVKVLDDLRAAGVNITRPDLKPFVEVGRKTWAESEARLGKDLIGKISAAAGH
ncbi:MAG TPA: TRAP transporter substrate-binding protein [Burkholderiales bacterium]|nr:TRAP transporter substrate-binding protein [Burkholderiales bacterium]